jgi:TPR repeat protein
MEYVLINRLLITLLITLFINGACMADVKPDVDDIKREYAKLSKLAQKGDVESQYKAFMLVTKNQPHLNESINEAFSYIISAGNSGHTEAQFTIGSLYQSGYILEKNLDLALGWLLEAANTEHVDAQVLVANNYSHKYLSSTDDIDKKKYFDLAKHWYEKSVKNSSIKGKRQYGEFLMFNDNFSIEAEKLLKEASLAGDLKAMNSLGLMYAYRWDKTNDTGLYKLAKSIFEESISLGYKSSESDLTELINKASRRVLGSGLTFDTHML